jgi:hypothetical protein
MSILDDVMNGGGLSFGGYEVDVVDQSGSRIKDKVLVTKVEFDTAVPGIASVGNRRAKGMSINLHLSFRGRKTEYQYYGFPRMPHQYSESPHADPDWNYLRKGLLRADPRFFLQGKRMHIVAQLKPAANEKLQVYLDSWEEKNGGIQQLASLSGGSFDIEDFGFKVDDTEVKPSRAADFRNSARGYTFTAGGQAWRVIRDQGVPHHARLVVKAELDNSSEAFFAQLHEDGLLTIQKLNKRGEYKGVGKNLVKEQL